MPLSVDKDSDGVLMSLLPRQASWRRGREGRGGWRGGRGRRHGGWCRPALETQQGRGGLPCVQVFVVLAERLVPAHSSHGASQGEARTR